MKNVSVKVFSVSSLLALPMVGQSALAADLNLKIDIPKLNVAEYHRPYVAVWIEKPDQTFAANLSVWYDIKKKENKGAKWLTDLRAWWRKSGRELNMPVDGVSSATRVVGEHALQFNDKQGDLAKLAAGDYVLMVEAARENGGRETVKIPFQWNGKAQTLSQQGSHELGKISLSIVP